MNYLGKKILLFEDGYIARAKTCLMMNL